MLVDSNYDLKKRPVMSQRVTQMWRVVESLGQE